jgi:hypothetical protein
VAGTCWEAVLNNNGKNLLEFPTFNKLQIIYIFSVIKVFTNILSINKEVVRLFIIFSQ